MQNLDGTGVALITPMFENGSIDLGSLEKLIDYVLDGQVNYVVSLGTTGESAVLSWEEKMLVLAHTISYVNRRVPVVLGLGGNNTTEILNKIEHLDTQEIAAILSVSPYYNKPSQQGLIRHYQAIAKQSKFPVILYNVPARTASNMEADTVLRLAESENIIAVKDASPDFSQLSKIAKYKPEHFMLLSGEDILALPTMSIGAEGAISVIANFLPRDFSQMIRLARAGDYAEALKLHEKLFETYQLLAEEGNPTSIKTALSVLGLCKRTVRLPLTDGSDALRNRFKAELKGMDQV